MEPMMVSTTALEMSPHSVRQARNFFRSNADRLGVSAEVRDRGAAMPVATSAELNMTGGRGLGIIDAVARAWGCDRHRDGGGKTVWFTLPRSASI